MAELRLVITVGSGVAVHYFGLDRTIKWLPKFVHYGIAGGVTTYALTHKPNAPAENLLVSLIGSVIGIMGGEVANFLM